MGEEKNRRKFDEDVGEPLSQPEGFPPEHLDSEKITPQMGKAHRAIRVAFGLALFWIALYMINNIALMWVVVIVAILLLVTGLIGVCPLCRLFKKR